MTLEKGPMTPCKTCLIRKAKQFTNNKQVDNSKKATRSGKRIFSCLVTINAPGESGITITNRNGYIVMNQYTGYKKLEFYCNKSDFVEPMCKKLREWKNNEKLVMYIRHNKALENKFLMKIGNDSQWKLGITAEYTRKGTPQ